MLIDRRLLMQFDYKLLLLALLIPCAGLTVLYSAGYDFDGKNYAPSWLPFEVHSQAFMKQSFFLIASLFVFLAGMLVPLNWLWRLAYISLAVCLVALLVVDVTGYIAKGSQRWLTFGGFRMQPSEPAKLAVVLALGRFLSIKFPRKTGFTLPQAIIPIILFAVPGALIVLQPDLGSGLMVMATGFAMILFAGIRPKTLFLLALPAIIMAYPAWQSLRDYQKRRVLVLLNPESDPRGSGYHINQSKIAIGSGAFLGKGYMQGTQTQLEFLPEHTTDFIFSVLAEEWGFVGCAFVLGLYSMLFVFLLKVVARARELFSALVIFGISSYIIVQTLINIGMVIGILPVVGLPLPLFSYGGSGLFTTMFALGIVCGLDMRRLYTTGASGRTLN